MNFTLEPVALNSLRARFFNNWVYLTGYGADRNITVFRKIVHLYDGETVQLENIPGQIEFFV